MACLYCQSTSKRISSSFKDIFEDSHHLSECQNCGVYYLDPLPTKEQLARAYDETYYGEGESKFSPIVERVVNWFRKQNARKFASQIPKDAKVLDIGCGNGSFLVSLGAEGEYKLHGIEPDGKSGDRASNFSEIELHRGYLEKDTYESNYYDAIILTHVFEHLPDPKGTLQIIKNIAKQGAILQIEIPNISSWQYRLYKGLWFHLDPPRHLNMFPPKVLKAELLKMGWSLESEKYLSPQFSPFGAQQSILNLIFKRDILYEHLKGNMNYTKSSSKFLMFLHQLFHWLSFPFFMVLDTIASLCKAGATIKLVFRNKS